MKTLAFALFAACLGTSAFAIESTTRADHVGRLSTTPNLTLLSGPFLLSPPGTGQVVPGQKWHLKGTLSVSSADTDGPTISSRVLSTQQGTLRLSSTVPLGLATRPNPHHAVKSTGQSAELPPRAELLPDLDMSLTHRIAPPALEIKHE